MTPPAGRCARLVRRARNTVAVVATPAAVTLVVAVLEAGRKWS